MIANIVNVISQTKCSQYNFLHSYTTIIIIMLYNVFRDYRGQPT